MSIFDRGVRGNVQNPFNGAGDAGTVAYSNPRMPSAYNGNVALGLNYILDALYPNYKGTVPTPSDLPQGTPATAEVHNLQLYADNIASGTLKLVYTSGSTATISPTSGADLVTKLTAALQPLFSGATISARNGNTQFFITYPASFGQVALPTINSTLQSGVGQMSVQISEQTVYQPGVPAASPNDYYIVADDGDGKSAGYVFSVVEGVTQWIKRYDVDYSAEGILAEAIDRTNYLYVGKYGVTDKDASGNPITGTYAGQSVYGGNLVGQNLTFFANKVDLSGLIQFANTLSPVANNIDLGTSSSPFRILNLSTSAKIGTMNLAGGAISDSSGAIALSAVLNASQKINANGGLGVGTLSFANGSITDSGGTISFGSNRLTTTGEIDAGVIKVADFTISTGSILSGGNAINFNSASFTGVNSLTASKVISTEVDIGDLVLTSATVKTATGTTLTLQAAGGGSTTTVQVGSALNLTSTLTAAGLATFNGNIVGAGTLALGSSAKVSTVSADARFEALAGNLILASTNGIAVNQTINPQTDAAKDLGTTALRFRNAYLSGGLSDGTNTVSMASLLSLRDINTNATTGMSLFYNGTEWLPSIPDTEIDHRTLSGLNVGDSGHPQFALLAGRSGGQTIFGGTAAGENLILDSTSNATKGLVLASSVLAPTTTQATDLGTSAKQWRHMYSSGIHYGLRLDQYAGSGNYPANASANVGRIIFDTTATQVLVDTGTAWAKVGNQKWLSTVTADGTTASYAVTVSSTISDARTGVWQLADNTNGFQRVQANLTINQTTVTITASPPLPSGSYTLVGFN